MSCDIGGYNVTVSTGTCDDAKALYALIGIFSGVSIGFFFLLALFIYSNRTNLRDNLQGLKIKEACTKMFFVVFWYGLIVFLGIVAGGLTIWLTVNISESVGWMWVGWFLFFFFLLSLIGLLVRWCLENLSEYTNLMNKKNSAEKGGPPGYRSARFDIA